jgi:hypothetical protein
MRNDMKFGLVTAMMMVSALAVPHEAFAANGRNGALIGGLAVGGVAGALLMNSMRPSHAAPRPVMEEEVLVERPRRVRYAPTCQMVRKKVWIDDETYTYKRVEVCE